MKLKTNFTFTSDLKSRFENKKVISVTESRFYPLLVWKGETENEYFLISFTMGVLVGSINEREMLLNNECYALAQSESCFSISTEQEQHKKVLAMDKYMRENYKTDMDELTFKDVMKFLKWKFINKKVKMEEMLF